MSFNINNNYSVSTGSNSNDAQVIIFQTGSPTTSDINFPIGKIWIDTSTSNLWILQDFTSTSGYPQANWIHVGTSLGPIQQYAVLVGGASDTIASITPDASTTKVLVSGGLSADPSWQDISTNALALAAFGSSANANAATLSGSTLTLQPASASFPGGVSTTTQTFAGAKTFSTSVSTPTSIVTGSSSGSITIQGQAAAGTYNFNLPITSGSSGQFLTSAGGGASAMTWTSISSSGAITTITGNSGGAQSPSSGNFNILGTGSITVAGSANTETVQLTGLTNHALQVGAGTATLTQLAVGATGTILIGNTGADPSFSATPSVTSITLGGGTALSNYLQGSFTPGFSFGGGTTGITYTQQYGVYTRIGNVVNFTLTIAITSKGSSTGAAKITGLPIAASGTGMICMINADGVTPVATYYGNMMNFDNAATTATLYSITTATGGSISALSDTNFANTTTVRATGIYFV